MTERELSPAAAASQTPSIGPMLSPDQLDDLGRALLVLARELWVTKDRQRILEAVLEERGIAVAEAVRDYQPKDAVAEELAAERQRFTQEIMRALVPGAPE